MNVARRAGRLYLVARSWAGAVGPHAVGTLGVRVSRYLDRVRPSLACQWQSVESNRVPA